MPPPPGAVAAAADDDVLDSATAGSENKPSLLWFTSAEGQLYSEVAWGSLCCCRTLLVINGAEPVALVGAWIRGRGAEWGAFQLRQLIMPWPEKVTAKLRL